MTWLSIDPGSVLLAWAQWDKDVLVACGLSKAPKHYKTAPERANYHLQSLPPANDVRICERMTIRGKFSKVDAQDLVDLNLIAGHVGNAWLLPSEWKGYVPRGVEQTRTRNALTKAELGLLVGWDCTKKYGQGHNVWSAVGIGLHVLGRAHVGLRKDIDALLHIGLSSETRKEE